jgi:hypothetical protein
MVFGIAAPGIDDLAMARIQFMGGAYSAESIIAAAQRSVNLFPEINPKDAQSPSEMTHYPRPGLTLLNPCPAPGRGRCLYASTANRLYAVVDQGIYYISPDWVWTFLGSLVNPGSTPCYMADNGPSNGKTIVVVDGSPFGFTIDMTETAGQPANTFGQIGDPNFLGADRVDYLDGFLVFNEPGTTEWYCSLDNQIAFNALDFGTKTAWPDNIQTLLAVHRQIWVLGSRKSEPWFNAGAAGFTFQLMPGVIIEHGVAAKYSPAKQDVKLYWLSQSPEGARMAMQGSTDLTAQRISTHAIEAEWQKYPRVDDAIGSTYQQNGHAFYLLHFPTADKTWAYDEASKLWHERAACDENGVLHRTRDSFNAYCYGVNIALDFSTGALYAVDPAQHVDQSLVGGVPSIAPIVCIRSAPHLVGDKFDRIGYDYITADVQVGTEPGTLTSGTVVSSPWSKGFSAGFGAPAQTVLPQISLRLSFTRGASWGNKRQQPLGSIGEYNTTPTWWQNGYGRDMVAEFSWSAPMKTALNGMFTDPVPFET